MKRPSPLSALGFLSTLTLCAMILASPALAQSPSFTKAFSPNTIGPGSISTLTFTITNSSSSPVRDLAFTDNLPAGMTVADPAKTTTTCLGTVTATSGSGTISFSDGGVGTGIACTITVDVTSSTPGTHTNVSGALSSSAGTGGTATADLTVATNRPGFTKSFSPGAVFFGGRSTLTFTIDNTANPNEATNLSFTDDLPSGMVVASPSNAATTCGGTVSAAAGDSAVSLSGFFPNAASVAANASCTVSVDVIAQAVGALGNTSGELTSNVQFSNRSSGKAGDTLTVTVEQIALTKSFTDDPASPGGTVTLEFTVRNLDRRSAATSIAFTDDLDATLSGLVATGLPLANPCGSGSTLSGTGVLSFSGGSLGIEETCTFSVTLDVPADATAGTYTNTTSSITASIGGGTATGDPATDLLFIAATPRLTKTFLDNPVGAGDTTTLEFTITNTSPTSSATDIAFEDSFDVVLPTASSVPASGFCGSGATATFTPLINPTGFDATPARLVVSGASLDPGASCTFSITLDVTVGAATGTYPNTTSSITATVDEATVTGNPASDDLEIVAAPRLFKEFIDDPVAAGDNVTLQFTLAHDEDAPGNATDISFSDDLSATLAGLTATGLPQSDVCGIGSQLSGTTNLTLSGGSLSPGESCTFNVTLTTPSTAASRRYTNTTSSVVATVLGLEVMENAASDDLQIAGLTLSKEFTDDPVLPGGTVNLRFTLENMSPTATATAIRFNDELDDVLSGLAATASSVPQSDICGTGSSLTGFFSNQRLFFQGGSLGPGESCTFDVTLQVPATAEEDTYINTTSSFFATFDGTTVAFDNAQDELEVVSNFLMLTKEFIDDPVAPGENVTLRFTVTNMLATETVSDIAFTDDLDAAMSGLVSVSGTLTDVCGTGSQVTGTSTLSFSGGSLAGGASCLFDVALLVPSDVELGETAVNMTSSVSGTVGGLLTVTGNAASDELAVDFLSFSKAFSGEATAGETVTLTFTIENLGQSTEVAQLSFFDDLGGVVSGLTAIGLPAFDVCGEGSELSGTTFLTFSGGSLLPGGSCTFSVDLTVPASASAGTYENVTSDLFLAGVRAADPAIATLTVIVIVDADEDGVLDGDDVCPGTVIPEGVPTRELRPNRHALIDDDFIFDTQLPPGGGGGPGETFTTMDTAGCSCEQIIAALGLGNGHTKFGCSLSAMRDWVELVNP